MIGDFETVKNIQPKITNLKLEDNTAWLDKLINKIEDMKKNISDDSYSFKLMNVSCFKFYIVAIN